MATPFQLVALDHLVLRTANPQQLIRFYCDVLCATVERDHQATSGLTQLRAGSALIDIVGVNSKLGKIGGEAPGDTGNNLDHFCLTISGTNIDALTQYLKTQQVDVGEIGRRYGAFGYSDSIYIKDPDGNSVELKPIVSE
ncbi:VOC family protein [Flocculibacter collagenilyticus]|uniref:VOC family protein n=1 Tax=Flocculibacter collagenilyticus TaxID=2744479 RepID=UPI0018F779AB|nr:VOC family protein [Flocculibacter collagenilyticus]